MGFRIGHGFDVHQLKAGLPLFLGGIKIEHDKGCVAHSDGDVLIHAISDALLGALALGDIGKFFPDSDECYRGIDSKILLFKVMQMIRGKDYEVSNVDATISMQRPKLRPYIDLMREKLAEVMNIPVENISIKATTTEHMGFEGEERGVSVTAVCILEQIKH